MRKSRQTQQTTPSTKTSSFLVDEDFEAIFSYIQHALGYKSRTKLLKAAVALLIRENLHNPIVAAALETIGGIDRVEKLEREAKTQSQRQQRAIAKTKAKATRKAA